MTDRYIVISSDCHAGGNHQQYREYLDPEWRDDVPVRGMADDSHFRAWIEGCVR